MPINGECGGADYPCGLLYQRFQTEGM